MIINSNLKHKNEENAKKSFHPLSVEYLIGEENNTETNRSNTLNEDEINNQENSSVLNRDSLINLLDDIKGHIINVENKFQNEIGKKNYFFYIILLLILIFFNLSNLENLNINLRKEKSLNVLYESKIKYLVQNQSKLKK